MMGRVTILRWLGSAGLLLALVSCRPAPTGDSRCDQAKRTFARTEQAIADLAAELEHEPVVTRVERAASTNTMHALPT